MVSHNLYLKRFFPLMTGLVLCGIDESGKRFQPKLNN